MIITVRYQYATYSGTRTVNAEDDDEAIAKVRQWVRSHNCIVPMAYESYQVVRALR